MKKMITMILMVSIILLIGCDSPPPEYDHNMDGWSLWATGLVDKAYIDINGSLRTFVIEFEGNQKIEAKRFYNFNDIVDGTEGSVYKWPSPNTKDYYMWVPKEDSFDIEKIIAEKEKEIGFPMASPAITKSLPLKTIVIDDRGTHIRHNKQDWVSVNSPPKYNQTVLIRFEDGLTTTAYYTPLKKWKADTDRRKMSGGIALKEVAKWKLVDLE